MTMDRMSMWLSMEQPVELSVDETIDKMTTYWRSQLRKHWIDKSTFEKWFGDEMNSCKLWQLVNYDNL